MTAMHFDCLAERQAKLLALRLRGMGRRCSAHPDQQSSDKEVPFPFELEGWIVVVQPEAEDDWDTYNTIADIAEEYSGETNTTIADHQHH